MNLHKFRERSYGIWICLGCLNSYKLLPQDTPPPQEKVGQPRKVAVHQKATPTTSSAAREHKVFMYEFSNDLQTNQPTINLISRSSPVPPGINSSHPISQSDPEKLVSPVYGVVPYLTSTWENRGESPNSKHLTMTSSAPVPIEQLIPSKSEPESLIVSIPRNLSHFSYVHSTTSTPPTNSSSLGGPRRKVLQSLAKKIAQKSRKYTTTAAVANSQSLQAQNVQNFISNELPTERVCSSCRRGNPPEKRKCVYCGCGLVRECSVCGMLNSISAMSCGRCHGYLNYTYGECVYISCKFQMYR